MSLDKLVDSSQLDADLTSVANAIRTKGGTSSQLAFPAGFVSAVQAIPTGGTPTGTKQIYINANGTTTEDVAAYANAEITVNVQGGGGGDNAVFALKDFVIGTNKWTAQNCIPNVLKNNGCLHIVFTKQTNSSSSGLSIFSFGVGALNAWSPGTSNPSCYINVSGNSDAVQMYARGVGNDTFNLTAHADSNGKVDLKLYSDRFVNVNTGETGYYNTNTQACMTAISSPNYISVGQNQSNTFAGFLITLIALEGN